MQIFFLEKNLHVTQFWNATFLQYIKKYKYYNDDWGFWAINHIKKLE